MLDDHADADHDHELEQVEESPEVPDEAEILLEFLKHDDDIVADFDARMVAEDHGDDTSAVYGALADDLKKRMSDKTSIDDVIPQK